MNIVLVYMSPNNTTRKISRKLVEVFSGDNHHVCEIDIGKGNNRGFKNIDLNIFKDADLIGIGSPVYHMSIIEPLYDFLKSYLPQIKKINNNIKAFLYLSYGGITTGKAFINTLKLLKENDIGLLGGFKVYAPHFWDVENYPYNNTLSLLEDFYKQISAKNFTAVEKERLDDVFGHPKLIIFLLYPLTHMIGEIRKLAINLDKSKCSNCKKCINECPVDAIKMNGCPVRDKSRCIYCYHCTIACPKKAIICDTHKLKKMIKGNKTIVGVEHPQNAIYI